MHIDPEQLVPKLPAPRDLRPFPTTLAVTYRGHAGKVRAVAPDPTGQWLLSGGDDGCVRLWEVASGRCMHTWQLGGPGGGDSQPVVAVAWCPSPALRLVSAAVGRRVVLLPSRVGGEEADAAAREALKAVATTMTSAGPESAAAAGPLSGSDQLAVWASRPADGGLELLHRHDVKKLTWHGRGDYFSTVAPAANTQVRAHARAVCALAHAVATASRVACVSI